MFYPSHISKDYFLLLLQVVTECVGESVQRLRSMANTLRNSCEVEAFQRKPLLTNTVRFCQHKQLPVSLLFF